MQISEPQALTRTVQVRSATMASTSSTRTIDQILSEADSLCSSGPESNGHFFEKIINQYQMDGTYLTRDMLQLLVYAMYGPDGHVPGNATVYHDVDAAFSFKGLFEPVSLLYQQTKFLVNYLEDSSHGDRGQQLIEGFIIAIRRQTPDLWVDNVRPVDEVRLFLWLLQAIKLILNHT
jgi:hypothetical protein